MTDHHRQKVKQSLSSGVGVFLSGQSQGSNIVGAELGEFPAGHLSAKQFILRIPSQTGTLRRRDVFHLFRHNESEKKKKTSFIIFILKFYEKRYSTLSVKNKFRNPYEERKPKKVGRLAQLSKHNKKSKLAAYFFSGMRPLEMDWQAQKLYGLQPSLF